MFGERLKKLRENKNLTQEQLAKKLHVVKSTISMYESNIRIPGADTLNELSKYFNVSTDYLLGNEHKMSEIEEKEVLKRMLIKAGYMKKGEDISDEKLDFLIKFIGRNKDLFKGEKWALK